MIDPFRGVMHESVFLWSFRLTAWGRDLGGCLLREDSPERYFLHWFYGPFGKRRRCLGTDQGWGGWGTQVGTAFQRSKLDRGPRAWKRSSEDGGWFFREWPLPGIRVLRQRWSGTRQRSGGTPKVDGPRSRTFRSHSWRSLRSILSMVCWSWNSGQWMCLPCMWGSDENVQAKATPAWSTWIHSCWQMEASYPLHHGDGEVHWAFRTPVGKRSLAPESPRKSGSCFASAWGVGLDEALQRQLQAAAGGPPRGKSPDARGHREKEEKAEKERKRKSNLEDRLYSNVELKRAHERSRSRKKKN